MCGEGGVHGERGMRGEGGRVWQRGSCVAKGVRAWLERRPLQRAVRILLECILVDPCTCTPIQKDWWASIPGCVWHSVRSNRLEPSRLSYVTLLSICTVSLAVHNKQKQILKGKGQRTHF